MPTLYIAASNETDSKPWATKLGDTVCMIVNAWAWARAHMPCQVLLSLCGGHQWNGLWDRFIRETNATVIWDKPVRDTAIKYAEFDRRREARQVNGMQFDIYREGYCRLDGGPRQRALRGDEAGLGRDNVFAYYHHGQELPIETEPTWRVDTSIIDLPSVPREDRILIAPVAVCQGNRTFTHEWWADVRRRVEAEGVSVTWNEPQQPEQLPAYVARHRLLCCGNTGIGWIAAATGTPLLACEPPDSYLRDFRYELCGVQSLVGIVSRPDAVQMTRRILQALDRAPTTKPSLPREPFLVPHASRVRANRVALDVGAATGEWLEVLSLAFSKVIAVEPIPANQATIREAAFPNVELLDCAAWQMDCALVMNTYDNPHIHAIADRDMHRGQGSAGQLSVQGRALDNLNLPPVDLIKIDVEGVECEVLRGLTRTIERDHPTLIIECHELENWAWASTWLGRIGYSIDRVTEPGRSLPIWLVATFPAA